DLGDLDLNCWTASFLSTASTNTYVIPPVATPTPNPPCNELRRLFYTPVGTTYQLEFEPGVRMMPWKEFQRYRAAGFLAPQTYGQQPQICAVTPDRTEVAFWPGSANAGDTIEIQYATTPTKGTQLPLLVNETDAPELPAPFHELIPLYGTHLLMPKARSLSGAQDYLKQYYDKLAIKRDAWKRRSQGDKQRFQDAFTARATSGPWGWW
ncbi:MAG: hypothetical protein KGL39_44850, partial [Patescibacteria group bacterium]|nr:hypothetical protein [Patescibacteria group bacterium]